jgi:hypothetical protein
LSNPEIRNESKIILLEHFFDGFGADAGRAFMQIDENKGKAWVHGASVASQTGNREFAFDVIDGHQLDQDGIQLKPFVKDVLTESVLRGNLESELLSNVVMDSSDRSAVIETANLALLSRLTKQGEYYNVEAHTRTIQESFGATYNSDGDHTHGGLMQFGGDDSRYVLLPHNARVDNYERLFEQIMIDDFLTVRNVMGLSEDPPMYLNGMVLTDERRNFADKANLTFESIFGTVTQDKVQVHLIQEDGEVLVDSAGDPYRLDLGLLYQSAMDVLLKLNVE